MDSIDSSANSGIFWISFLGSKVDMALVTSFFLSGVIFGAFAVVGVLDLESWEVISFLTYLPVAIFGGGEFWTFGVAFVVVGALDLSENATSTFFLFESSYF